MISNTWHNLAYYFQAFTDFLVTSQYFSQVAYLVIFAELTFLKPSSAPRRSISDLSTKNERGKRKRKKRKTYDCYKQEQEI